MLKLRVLSPPSAGKRWKRPAQLALAAGVVAAIASPVPAASAAGTKGSTTKITKRSGAYQAVVTAKRTKAGYYNQISLRVKRQGSPWSKSTRLRKAGRVTTVRPHVLLRDLNGDRTPEVIVRGFTGGAHCCSVSSIAFSTSQSTWAPVEPYLWPQFYALKDLGNDGVYELISGDARFDYTFASHAGSSYPVTVHRGQGTKLVDVSVQYPEVLRADADALRARWQELKGNPAESRSALAAGLADLLRLEALDEARTWVTDAIQAGNFDDTGDTFEDANVGARLVEWGYLTDFSLIGLPQ